jgi:hypothetical protein
VVRPAGADFTFTVFTLVHFLGVHDVLMLAEEGCVFVGPATHAALRWVCDVDCLDMLFEVVRAGETLIAHVADGLVWRL